METPLSNINSQTRTGYTPINRQNY